MITLFELFCLIIAMPSTLAATCISTTTVVTIATTTTSVALQSYLSCLTLIAVYIPSTLTFIGYLFL